MKRKSREEEVGEGLEAFVSQFKKLASKFRWFLLDDRKLRAKVEGVTCCPLQVVGYVKRQEKELPDARDMAVASGVSDPVAAAVVHHADEIASSRYYRPEVRRQLLAAAGVEEEGAAED